MKTKGRQFNIVKFKNIFSTLVNSLVAFFVLYCSKYLALVTPIYALDIWIYLVPKEIIPFASTSPGSILPYEYVKLIDKE